MTSDYKQRQRTLRWWISLRGLDGVMQDLSDVCKDIAADQRAPKWANVWYDRASEFKEISQRWENSVILD